MTANPNPPSPNAPAIAKATSTWGQQAAVVTGKPVYDPQAFYTRATDVRGHGEKIGGRIPPELHHQIMQLISSDLMPDYTCVMDFVRDACTHHLRTRSAQIADVAMRDRLRGFADEVARREAVVRARQQLEAFDEHQAELRKLLTRYFQDGAWAQMAAELDETERFWQDRGEPYGSKMMTIVDDWRAQLPAQWR